MSQWTSEYMILQDLAVAQGRQPVAVGGAVGVGDKPPSLDITEETEEEFFKHCSADADVNIAPELGLIKRMLDMVRDENLSSDEELDPNKKIVITKLNPTTPAFIPKVVNTSTPVSRSPDKQIIKKEKPKKKRQRNVALESILKAISDIAENKTVETAATATEPTICPKLKNRVTQEPIKLLKPNDFIAKDLTETSDKTKAVENHETAITEPSEVIKITKDKPQENVSPDVMEKVTGWLKTQTDSPFPKKSPRVALEPVMMFKKKSSTNKVKKVSEVISPSSLNSKEYKPSELANEYYQKYVERNKFKASVKEDIWMRAERQMKEIDEKRKMEAAQSSTTTEQVTESEPCPAEDVLSVASSNNISTDTTNINKKAAIDRCMDIVSLPQHRHLLTGECIVCKVLCKREDSEEHLLITL